MPSYLIISNLTNSTELGSQLSAELGFPLTQLSEVNDPTATLTIDQVRTLIGTTHFASNSNQPMTNWLLWNLHTSSIPAQNALLKLLEEPPVKVNIFVIAPSLEGVLPTIQSRCVIIKLTNPESPEPYSAEYNPADLYQQICQSNIPDIIGLAEKLGTVELATLALKELIAWLHHQPTFPSTTTVKHLQLLNEANAALFANANPRLTLEHCFFEMNKAVI